MKKLNIILLALVGMISFASCDSFLDVKPTNYGDSKTSVQSKADAEFMMYGIMSRLTSSVYYGRNMLLYADAKGGDMTVYSNGRGNDALYNFNHEYNSGAYGDFWTSGYDLILQLNNLLTKINELEEAGSSEDFDKVKGQAHTLRALMYFEMVRLYGLPYTLYDPETSYGLPVITKEIDIQSLPTRGTVQDTYDLILEDLEAGAELLPTGTSNGYVNYWVNRAIAARVFLTMGNYDDALDAAEEVINSNKFSLYENKDWVESWAKQFGTESIFELYMNPEEGDLGNSSLGMYYCRYKHYSSKAYGYYGASDAFIARLAEDPTDIRHGVFSYDEVSKTRMGASYKYFGGLSMDGDGKDTDTAVNIKVIRLSEMYLIAAEAALCCSEPDAEAAAEYLQAIRKRSPGLAPATADNVTVDMILDEKSKEFFSEGLRYWDMLRLGKEIEYNDEILGIDCPHRPKVVDTKTFYKVVLPLPENELNANPEIAKQQNPGYNTPYAK